MEQAGLYVHIPFCKAKCAYCNFNSGVDLRWKKRYLASLLREAELSQSFCPGGFDTVYFGGGTPSLLSAEEFSALYAGLKGVLKIAAGAECTVECNPESVTEEKLERYRSCGVTRISLGVQSLSDACLKAVGRLHDAAGARRAAKQVAAYFENYGADFILGLPYERPEDVEAVIDFVREFGVKHVSAYGLTLEPETELYLRAAGGKVVVPDADTAADRYEKLFAALKTEGVFRYETSNFARPGYECRHNEKYWSLSPYLGLGVSAHSYVAPDRFFNGSGVVGYVEKLERGERFEAGRETISPAESEKEYLMLRFRTTRGVSRAEYAARFGCDIVERYRDVFSRYGKFFEVGARAVRVSDAGFYVVNSLLIEFE